MNETNIEIQQLRDELAQARQEYKDFISVINHDLGAPIRHIRGFVRILETHLESSDDEETAEYLDFITSGADKAYAMLNALTEFGCAQIPQESISDIDLEVPFQKAAALLSPLIRDSGAQVDIPSLPFVHGSSEHISEIFYQILKNSLIYQPQGQTPKISISTKENEHSWDIHIKDNGIGIPVNMQEKVFKALTRAVLEDDFPGIGMGLSASQKSIRIMKGDLFVATSTEAGTDMCIRFRK